jgi:hypothetical protein
MTVAVDRDDSPEPELRPERVDLDAGTISVDVAAIEERWDRLREFQGRMEDAAAAFRSVGLTGPADLVSGWAADVEEQAGWLGNHVREVDLAREIAGLADARGITFAQALALGRSR